MTTPLARFGYMDNTEKDDGLSAMMTDEGIKQKMHEAVMDFQARPAPHLVSPGVFLCLPVSLGVTWCLQVSSCVSQCLSVSLGVS